MGLVGIAMENGKLKMKLALLLLDLFSLELSFRFSN